MFVENVRYTTEEGITTNHLMIRHDEPVGLFLLLPGANNAPDRPFMHLVRKGMLDYGYDILNIDYSMLINKEDDYTLNCKRILEVVKGVLLQRLDDYRGLKVSLFCRSIGSIVGTELAKYPFVKFHKIVMISPTRQTIDGMDSLECKVYLDPKDKHINNESYNKLKSMKEVLIKEYEGAGHNFEYDNDLEQTIDTLKDVVIDMVAYMIES